MQRMVKCEDCNGTGAAKGDCWLCHGIRDIHWRKATRHGYRKGDLLFECGDDYVRCPVCDGDVCSICSGDGRVEPMVPEQARDRVLAFAHSQRIPPLVRVTWRGFALDHDALLSKAAAIKLHEEGLIYWCRSMFGDELSATPRGKRAAHVAAVKQQLLCNLSDQPST